VIFALIEAADEDILVDAPTPHPIGIAHCRPAVDPSGVGILHSLSGTITAVISAINGDANTYFYRELAAQKVDDPGSAIRTASPRNYCPSSWHRPIQY
jgi:hypothetical protein